MASVKDETCLSDYRKLLIELSLNLSSNDLEMLTFAAVDFIPRGRIENIRTGLQFFDVLEQDVTIGPRNMSLLQDMFQTIGRVDLARRIQSYLTGSVKVDIDGERDTVTTDGGSDTTDNHPAIPKTSDTSQAEPVQVAESAALTSSVQLVHQPLLRGAADCDSTPAVFCARGGDQRTSHHGPSSGLIVPVPAASHAGQHRGTEALSSGRVQHDPSVGPSPVRYVNFLACGGYTVEIIGGKHFKTPEGEFVELKSGTQYKIHVKNSHAYGCYLDISIDGYDVGGWTVDAGRELSIERPVSVAKKFTFYRVKTAPTEAGIESGRSENGVVKCVFTPEAFLDIPVVISSLTQPLDMNMPPSATVGDLKREVQSKLNQELDPDQVLALGNQVLSNFMRLRNLLEQASGNLRLIDVEMQITVKTSSRKTFLVKLHPGKAKVHDLMELIEREIDVPSRDQKLYLGSALLSDSPRKGLPPKLICNPQLTVDVKIPEYINITVEDENGDSRTVKIDKEKSLTALMEEIPSCSSLQENEEATFFFSGKPLCPFKDEGTLKSFGLCSGSKLVLKLNVAFLELFVDVWFSNYEIRIRCSPQETFKDLVKKVEMESGKRNLVKVTFAMDGRVFDPEKDKGPLRDYEVKHRSQLQLRLVRPTPEVKTGCDSKIPLEAEVLESLKESGEQLDKVLEMQQMAYAQCSDHTIQEEGTKDKKSVLSAIKRKFRSGKPEKIFHRSEEMYGHGSPPPPPPPSAAAPVGAQSRRRHLQSRQPPAQPPPPPPPQQQQFFAQCGHKKRGDLDHDDQEDELYQDEREEYEGHGTRESAEQELGRVTEPDPAWRAGGTTLQGYSTQQFMAAEPIKVDPSRKVELVLRLVAREDEKDLVFPKDECKPLSTLYPPAVPE